MDHDRILKGRHHMPDSPTNRQIPRTRLREIYKLLTTCSRTRFQLDFARELSRGNNPKMFSHYLHDDVQRFHQYDNTQDELCQYNNRRALPDIAAIQSIECTNDLSALLEHQQTLEVRTKGADSPINTLHYIEREVRPCRTTGNATYVDGLTAAAQPHLDLLLADKARQPYLGEVKIGGDRNPFYALIQLLMYASELLGPYQKQRLGQSFRGRIDENFRQLDLLIVIHNYNYNSTPRVELLNTTDTLAMTLMGFPILSQYIRSISCINVKFQLGQAGPYADAELLFTHRHD